MGVAGPRVLALDRRVASLDALSLRVPSTPHTLPGKLTRQRRGRAAPAARAVVVPRAQLVRPPRTRLARPAGQAAVVATPLLEPTRWARRLPLARAAERLATRRRRAQLQHVPGRARPAPTGACPCGRGLAVWEDTPAQNQRGGHCACSRHGASGYLPGDAPPHPSRNPHPYSVAACDTPPGESATARAGWGRAQKTERVPDSTGGTGRSASRAPGSSLGGSCGTPLASTRRASRTRRGISRRHTPLHRARMCLGATRRTCP